MGIVGLPLNFRSYKKDDFRELTNLNTQTVQIFWLVLLWRSFPNNVPNSVLPQYTKV
jgi:hypothetical protein